MARLIVNGSAILKLYEEGLQPKQIAKELGYPYHQPVYSYLHKVGKFVKHKNGDNFRRKYAVDESFFDYINSDQKAYILGFIAADGHVCTDHNRIVIKLNKKDIDILYKIRTSMHSEHPIYEFTKDGKYDHCGIAINSKALITRLLQLGITNNKSLTLTSEIFTHVPDEFKLGFLRGFFDGDGSVIYCRKYLSGTKYIVTVIGTEDFLLNTYKVIFPSRNPLFKYKTCEMYGWRLSSKADVDHFLKSIYENSTIHLDRKYAVYSAHLKPGELLETHTGQSAAEPHLEEGSETIEKQPNS